MSIAIVEPDTSTANVLPPAERVVFNLEMVKAITVAGMRCQMVVRDGVMYHVVKVRRVSDVTYTSQAATPNTTYGAIQQVVYRMAGLEMVDGMLTNVGTRIA